LWRVNQKDDENIKNIIILLLIPLSSVLGQSVVGNIDNLPVHEYSLTINEEMVNKAGKEVKDDC
jgi:hypothetical protein